MPEGPSIVILKELVAPFTGKVVKTVGGNAKIEKERADGKKVLAFKSWGKHFLICFSGFTIRIHFMLFGSYLINEEKKATPRLSLVFNKGFIHFYSCSIKIIEGDLDEQYDWSEDIMSDDWDAAKAKSKLKVAPEMLACDALLDQHIFSGSGNIIKNEVLFRTKIDPRSIIGALPTKKLNEMVKEARNYSFDFLKWKKAFELKKHWQAHTKKTCPRCDISLVKEYLGKTKRRTFYCTQCQVLYT